MRKALILVILALVAGFGLYRMGFVRFNYPDVGRYPVLGVDVSHHQGPIRWAELRSSGISFAFIKATEGADHQDAAFALNWQQAGAAGVARGAYHFFTFCADGSAQADNFIATVPALGGELPPVADVEFGGNCKEWPSVEEIREGLSRFLAKVEQAYGRRPIIYTTCDASRRILGGWFTAYSIWARSLIFEPGESRFRHWLFWQYADNGRVPGIDRLVDLNVFRGPRAEFETLLERTGT